MNKKFCERLKELRLEKDLTQKEFGKRFKIANNTVSSWERGNSSPSADDLIELSKFFDVSVDYLLGITDEPERR